MQTRFLCSTAAADQKLDEGIDQVIEKVQQQSSNQDATRVVRCNESHQIEWVVKQMQQESSSPSTPSIWISLLFGWDFLGRPFPWPHKTRHSLQNRPLPSRRVISDFRKMIFASAARSDATRFDPSMLASIWSLWQSLRSLAWLCQLSFGSLVASTRLKASLLALMPLVLIARMRFCFFSALPRLGAWVLGRCFDASKLCFDTLTPRFDAGK
jgi:hypothetical protein